MGGVVMRLKSAERPKTSDVIDVAVIDKNPLILRGLDQMLYEDGRMRLVMTSPDGAAFLESWGADPRGRRVDVLVSGWIMKRCNGETLLRNLAEEEAAPKVVIYTGEVTHAAITMARKVGAKGFIPKSDAPERLLDAIATVARGEDVFPEMEPIAAPLRELTPRELELLSALARGATNAELAEEFDVSVNTVKFHLRNLYDKLSVGNRAQAVALYLSL